MYMSEFLFTSCFVLIWKINVDEHHDKDFCQQTELCLKQKMTQQISKINSSAQLQPCMCKEINVTRSNIFSLFTLTTLSCCHLRKCKTIFKRSRVPVCVFTLILWIFEVLMFLQNILNSWLWQNLQPRSRLKLKTGALEPLQRPGLWWPVMVMTTWRSERTAAHRPPLWKGTWGLPLQPPAPPTTSPPPSRAAKEVRNTLLVEVCDFILHTSCSERHWLPTRRIVLFDQRWDVRVWRVFPAGPSIFVWFFINI